MSRRAHFGTKRSSTTPFITQSARRRTGCQCSRSAAAASVSGVRGPWRTAIAGAGLPGNDSEPVGSTCSTWFICCLSAASSAYIRRRARLEFPSGLCAGQAVPRVVAQHVGEPQLLVGVETLPEQPQPGDGHVRRQPLRPLHRGVLQRHEVRVGLHLDHEVHRPVTGRERSHHRVAQIVLGGRARESCCARARRV